MDEQGCSRLLADANGRILDPLAGLEKNRAKARFRKCSKCV